MLLYSNVEGRKCALDPDAVTGVVEGDLNGKPVCHVYVGSTLHVVPGTFEEVIAAIMEYDPGTGPDGSLQPVSIAGEETKID